MRYNACTHKLSRRIKNTSQVEFERPVDAKGNIEVWLQRLVDGMQGTVKHVIKRAVRNIYVSGGGGSVCVQVPLVPGIPRARWMEGPPPGDEHQGLLWAGRQEAVLQYTRCNH